MCTHRCIHACIHAYQVLWSILSSRNIPPIFYLCVINIAICTMLAVQSTQLKSFTVGFFIIGSGVHSLFWARAVLVILHFSWVKLRMLACHGNFNHHSHNFQHCWEMPFALIRLRIVSLTSYFCLTSNELGRKQWFRNICSISLVKYT